MAKRKLGTKRHRVDIMAPPTTLDGRGQIDANEDPVTVAQGIPCSIEPLQGRELELARQVMANAQHKVTVWASNKWKLTTQNWLVFNGRRLNIGHISDTSAIGHEYVLTCGEAA